MNEILIFTGFVVLTSTSTVGLWALGRYLRSKGYGPQLDKLNRQLTAIQLRVRPLALSASYRMFAGTQILNRLPLLGSKNSAALNHQVLIAIQAAQEAQKREKPTNR